MIQPVHLPTAAAQAGSCCTPQRHPPTARAETPDTAKLLQRALASSSGSALLSSSSQEPSNSHPECSVPAGFTGLNQGGAAAIAASSVAVQLPLSDLIAPTVRSEQQNRDVGSAAVSSSSSETALVSSCLPSALPDNCTSAAGCSTSSPSASTLRQASQKGSGVASALLINQEAVSQKQVWATDQSPKQSASHRQQLAGTDQQMRLSSAFAGQQYGASKQAKHTGQPRKGLETEGQVLEGIQAAVYQQPSVGLKQAAGHDAGPLQQEGAGLTGAGLVASTADSAGHVTSQVQLHLACSGLMFLRDSRPDCA